MMLEKRMDLVDSIGPLGILAAGAGLGLVGGLVSSSVQHKRNQDLMTDQQGMNEAMYRQRYQWTMQDMKKAGLNPILAAKGIGGTFPQVSLPSAGMPNMNISSSAKDVADVELKDKQKELAYQQANNEIETIARTRAEARKISAEEQKALADYSRLHKQIQEMTQRIKTLSATEKREHADIERINKQAVLLRGQAMAMIMSLEKLSKIESVYKGPAGQIIAYLNAILGTLNVGGGVVYPIKTGGK